MERRTYNPTDKELLNKETRERWLASYGLKPYDGGVMPMQVPSRPEFKGGEKPPELFFDPLHDMPAVFSEDFSQFNFSDLRKMLSLRKRITPEDTAALPSSAEERDAYSVSDVSEELLSPHKQSQASSPVSSFIPLEPLSPFAPEMQMEDNKQDSRKRKAEPTIAPAKRQRPNLKKSTNRVPVETVDSDSDSDSDSSSDDSSEFVFDDDEVREAEPAPTVPLNTRSQGSTSPTPTVPATYVDLFGVSKKERKKWVRQWTRNILMKPAKKEEELSRQFQCLSIANWPARRQAGKADMSTQTSAFVALMWRTALLASSLSKNIAFGLLRVICENLRKTLYDAPNVVNAQQAKLFVENRFMGACTAWLHVMQKHGEMYTTFMNLMCAVVEAWRVDAGVMSQYTWHSQLKWYCGLPQALAAVIKEADATIVSNATACLQNLAPPVQQTAREPPSVETGLPMLWDLMGSAELRTDHEVTVPVAPQSHLDQTFKPNLRMDPRDVKPVLPRKAVARTNSHIRAVDPLPFEHHGDANAKYLDVSLMPNPPPGILQNELNRNKGKRSIQLVLENNTYDYPRQSDPQQTKRRKYADSKIKKEILSNKYEPCVAEFPNEGELPPVSSEMFEWHTDISKTSDYPFANAMAMGSDDWPVEFRMENAPTQIVIEDDVGEVQPPFVAPATAPTAPTAVPKPKPIFKETEVTRSIQGAPIIPTPSGVTWLKSNKAKERKVKDQAPPVTPPQRANTEPSGQILDAKSKRDDFAVYVSEAPIKQVDSIIPATKKQQQTNPKAVPKPKKTTPEAKVAPSVSMINDYQRKQRALPQPILKGEGGSEATTIHSYTPCAGPYRDAAAPVHAHSNNTDANTDTDSTTYSTDTSSASSSSSSSSSSSKSSSASASSSSSTSASAPDSSSSSTDCAVWEGKAIVKPVADKPEGVDTDAPSSSPQRESPTHSRQTEDDTHPLPDPEVSNASGDWECVNPNPTATPIDRAPLLL